MSNYSDKWFNDSIKWYVFDNLLNAELPLFTEVYTVFTSEVPGTLEYNSISDLLQSGLFSYSRATAYSVERLGVDGITLTCRYVLGSPTINSLALVTEYNGSSYLIAKITRDQSAPVIVPNGYDRVFNLKLPYKTVGVEKVYPNVSFRIRRYSNSPIGEELVTLGEHHHNVDWGSSRDSIPTLSRSLGRYVASSEYNKQDGFKQTNTSYVYNENGVMDSSVASITGKLTSPENADISSTFVDRFIPSELVQNLLANVMEEYLMATNSIQILGHAIPVNANSDPSENTNDNTNLLYVTRTDATNERALKAVTMATFRDWLVKRFTFKSSDSGSSVSSTACVNVIDTEKNISVTLTKASQVALVTNVKSVSSSINDKVTVTYSGGSIDIYPRETAVIVKGPGDSSSYISHKIGSTDLLRSVLNGTYGFSKVSFSSTAGSNSLLDDNFTVTNGKVNSEVGGSFSIDGTLSVTGDASLSSKLNVTGATTLSSTLGVSGKSTLSDALEVKKKASVGTSLAAADESLVVTGAANLKSSLGVTGNSTLGGTLGVTGATTLSSLGVTGAATLSSTLSVTGASTLTGGVNSGLTVNSGDFSVSAGTATISKKLTVSSEGIAITGDSKITGKLEVTKNLKVTSGGITAEGQTISAGSNGTISAGTVSGISELSASNIIATSRLTVGESSIDTGCTLKVSGTIVVSDKVTATNGYFVG